MRFAKVGRALRARLVNGRVADRARSARSIFECSGSRVAMPQVPALTSRATSSPRFSVKQITARAVEPRVKHSLVCSVRVLGIAVTLGGVVACSTSPMSRIDSNRGRYESWPLEVQEAVLSGKARKGMTAEQVEMAMGKPTEVVTRSAKAGEDEVWVYRKGGGLGSGLLGNTGVSVGGGMGGVNVGTGMGGGRRQSPDESEVVFAKGVVVRSDTDK